MGMGGWEIGALVGVHLKVLEGETKEEQPRFPWARSAQIQICSLSFFGRASNLAWVSGHFAAGALL